MSHSGKYFQKDDGTRVPTASYQALSNGFLSLRDGFHLSPPALAEGPAYGLAMVVRYALGLSAAGGLICGLVRDTFCGNIAINCLRHLKNAGSDIVILVLGHPEDQPLSYIANALESAKAFGMKVEFWSTTDQNDLVVDLIQECHNIIFGGSDIEFPIAIRPPQEQEFINQSISILNELSTPVHCILAPHGVNLETGEPNGERLFASSTMALGAPLDCLTNHTDLIGRLYLADMSFPRSFYTAIAPEFPILFDEQPIIRLEVCSTTDP